MKKQGETSYKQTAFGIIPRSELILLEAQGLRKAVRFIINKREKSKIPITPNFLKKLHHVGFGWIFPKWAGQYRKIEVKVSKHTPPKYFQIPALMEDFTRDIKIRLKHLPEQNSPEFPKELVSLLAWTHYRFVWIHPFLDYNGRLGRLLVNIILLNLDLSPIELKVETPKGREKYIKALQKADTGDFIQIEKIITEALKEGSKEV